MDCCLTHDRDCNSHVVAVNSISPSCELPGICSQSRFERLWNRIEIHGKQVLLIEPLTAILPILVALRCFESYKFDYRPALSSSFRESACRTISNPPLGKSIVESVNSLQNASEFQYGGSRVGDHISYTLWSCVSVSRNWALQICREFTRSRSQRTQTSFSFSTPWFKLHHLSLDNKLTNTNAIPI
jgi:hypothetical protein